MNVLNVLKSISYVQNMILTLCLDESYFFASWGGYVASIKTMSRDKLKHQVTWQFLSGDITFMWHWRLGYTMTEKQADAEIDAFFTLTTCEVLWHAANVRCVKKIYSVNTYGLLHFEHKNDVTIIITLYKATCLQLVALYKSLTMIVTSLLCSKCNRT